MGNSDKRKFGATGPAINPNNRSDKFGWADGSGSGAVRVRLSPEQREACSIDFQATGLDLAELFEFVDAGFKFSLSYSGRNKCYFATGTDKRDGSETEGRWVTISAGNPDEAIFRVLWVLGSLVQGDLIELEELSNNQSYDW